MAKKAAKKRSKKAEAEPGHKAMSGLGSIRNKVSQSLALAQKYTKSTRTTVESADSMQKPIIELPHLAMQYLFANRYFRTRTMLEVVGEEGLGKTTLVGWFIGMFGRIGAATHMAQTEAKMMSKEQMLRAISPDVAVATEIYDAMMVTKPKSIEHWMSELRDIVMSVRGTGKFVASGPAIPKDAEFLHVVDTRSKLMPDEEAAAFYSGFSAHMTKDKTKKARGVAEVRATSIAKETTSVMRRMPNINEDLGITVMTVAHKQISIDMNASKSAGKFAAYVNKRKATTSGGVAPRQNASYILIATRDDMPAFDENNRVIGKRVFLFAYKNSFGSDAERGIHYTLRTEYTQDTDTYKEPAIDFDGCLADMLVEKEILGTKLTGGRYTCKELGAVGVTARELSEIIHSSSENKERVGACLGIQGYKGVAVLPVPTSTIESDLAEHEDDETGEEEEEEGGSEGDNT